VTCILVGSLVLFVVVDAVSIAVAGASGTGKPCDERLESPSAEKLLPQGARTFIRAILLEVAFLKGTLHPEASCPHADNDRIAAIRTNQSPPRGNYINHIAAAALARNVRCNGYRESRTGHFEDQANVSCRNPVVREWSDPEVGRQTRR
jgi:hypothetical protein